MNKYCFIFLFRPKTRHINHPFGAAEGRAESFIYRNQFSCDNAGIYTIFLRPFLSPIRTAFILFCHIAACICAVQRRYLRTALLSRYGIFEILAENTRNRKCERRYTSYTWVKEYIDFWIYVLYI